MIKKIIFSLFVICSFGFSLNAQSASTIDTNFRFEIVNFEWMPDNASILLNITKSDKRRKSPREYRVYMVNLSSHQLQLLFEDAESPSPSPDGKHIAYVQKLPSGKSDIYLYDTEKKTQVPLHADSVGVFGPQWSPDGNELAYDIIRTTRIDNRERRVYNICVMNMTSKTVRQITRSDVYSSFNPVWSPKGEKIVYFLEKGDDRDQIYVTDPMGRTHTNLTNDTATLNFYPSWVGDEQIVYTRAPGKLMIMGADGSGCRLLNDFSSIWTRFNPRNNKVAYLSRAPESTLIVRDWVSKTEENILPVSQLAGLF